MQLPSIKQEQIDLLEKLSNACAVSGNEREVRMIIKEEIRDLADSYEIDALGNLIAVKKAKIETPMRVLISSHMDEVGFMLVNEEDPGIYCFRVVGGIDPRALAGKAVWVGKDHKPGLIGACPVHLSTPEERQKILSVNDLRIDTGPGTKEIKVGDTACFATRFTRMGTDSICGKALDNRLGCAVLIELLKNVPDHIELIAAFTVQEEVGLRGARVVAWDRNPDVAFAIDSTPANDLPMWDGSESTEYKTRLDQGPAIYTMDGRTLNDPRLIRYLLKTADQYKIKCQLRQPAPGGTDAGAIHQTQAGCPAVSVSVPGRYAHTAASIARISDWQAHLQLMTAALYDMNRSILEEER